MSKSFVLHDVENDIVEGSSGLAIKRTQEIPDSFLQGLAEKRSYRGPESDFMHVGSIPVAVVEKWMREGFDILSDKNTTLKDIIKRLQAEDLTAFLATSKNV